MTEIEHETPQEELDIPYFFTLERYDQRRALESLIFASEDPLTTRVMHRVLVLEDPTQEVPGQQALPLEGEEQPEERPAKKEFEVPKGYFDELVDEINEELETTDRPFRIVKIAGGYQFATTPQHGQLVQRLLKARNRKRLTQAAMETLAIVAYRQPLTKGEVDAIRGVNSGEVVNSLVEKGLLTIVGRSETPGKPLLYGTTDEFLRIFGLNSLSELPKLREIDDLLKTTTTMIEADETITISTDHRTLRRQLSMLLEETEEGRAVLPPAEDTADQEATSGAYWHHSMENEEEHREYIEDSDSSHSDSSHSDSSHSDSSHSDSSHSDSSHSDIEDGDDEVRD